MAQSFPPPPQDPNQGYLPPPPRRKMRTSTLVLIVVASMIVVIAGVGAVGYAAYRVVQANKDEAPSSEPAPPPPSPSGPLPSTDTSLARFYGQKLDWSDCGTYQCTRLTVPLDYAHPEGETIRLAVLRVPAEQRSRRVGQLVVNPGGPGGSAIEYAAAGSLAFGETIARYYDIVGMDPRGVGRSTPLECLRTAARDEFLAADPSPDDPAEVQGLDKLIREFGDACLARSGELARHMSTVEAAKDMDVLRAALGEPKLDYHGASYGTLLGATYADLFPKHVGRMVLDGAIDPSLSTPEFTLGQAKGFQTALEAFIDDCVGRLVSPRQDKKEALARIDQLLDQIDRKPLETGSDRELTEGLASAGIAYPSTRESLWPRLRSALGSAIDDGDGSELLELADQYNSRARRLHRQRHQRPVCRQLPRPRRLPPQRPGPEPLRRVRQGGTDVLALVRLQPLHLLHLAGAERQAHHGTARSRGAADRGHRYDEGPGHAVPLGGGARQAARLGPADQPRRRRPHRLQHGQQLRRRRRQRLPRQGQGAQGRVVLLTISSVPEPAPILVRRARLPGRAPRRLSSVGRAIHS